MKSVTLPAEWAPQSAVMLTWPHQHSDWQPWLDQVEPVFCEIAYQISLRQQLLICCWDELHRSHIARQLQERGADPAKLNFHVVPSNDTWARDHGPITVVDHEGPKLLDFTFNGWGKKYEAEFDNAVTTALFEGNAFKTDILETIEMVLEGGSIESDGNGTLLTTEQCLLNDARNPELSKPLLEQVLQEVLGIKRFLWLSSGHLVGDDTDSHIDTLARFCDEKTIAYVSCDDAEDEHYAALKKMEEELQSFRTAEGRPYNLVALPLPKAIYNSDGCRLPATHANFLIINDAVLVPTYNDPDSDNIALERLAACFPERQIVAVDCAPLIMQYGSLHCVTMQLPQGLL